MHPWVGPADPSPITMRTTLTLANVQVRVAHPARGAFILAGACARQRMLVAIRVINIIIIIIIIVIVTVIISNDNNNQ